MENLGKLFETHLIEVLYNEPLKNWCTFKIGGNAGIFVQPKNAEEIAFVVTQTKKAGVPLFTLGKGSNLLFSDNGFNGVVMHIGRNMSDIKIIDETTIYSQSGAMLQTFCNFAMENSLTGMETLYGIPGSVGGAVYMNAGAYGGEICDIAYSADYVDLNGRKGTLVEDELDFSYRHSAFTDNGNIITGLTVKLQKGEKSKIKAAMADYMGRRKSKQPLEYPSGGSTFKRPVGNFASALIDQCGLKGTCVGEAMVSEKHAGFVINKGNATAKEVLELIEIVKAKVYKEKGIDLECEIKIID